jgi:hypothetical protein
MTVFGVTIRNSVANMRFHLAIGALLIALAACSFLATLALLSRPGSRGPASYDVSEVAVFAGTLARCKATPAGSCGKAEEDLVRAIIGSDKRKYDFYRKSVFEVIYHKGVLIFFKEVCDDSDSAVDNFVWHLWPMRQSELPEERRQYGFIGENRSFKQFGSVRAGTCLLVARTPFAAVDKIEAGQYEAAKGKWKWFVNGPVFARL